METLLDQLYDNGPQRYTLEDLSREIDVFRNRTALFYTPTDQIPKEWIGQGELSIKLPIVSPTIFEWHEILAYRGPRLWVDLIQRATGKLRWIPLVPAKVTLIRCDSAEYSDDDAYTGAKAILDALKVKTAGRTDGRVLYYFGAILDDNKQCLSDFRVEQKRVDHPSKAYSQIIVEPT